MPIQPQGAAKQREAPKGRSAVCMAKQREIRLAYMSLFLVLRSRAKRPTVTDKSAVRHD